MTLAFPGLLVGLLLCEAPQPDVPRRTTNLGVIPATTIPLWRASGTYWIAVAPDGKSVACATYSKGTVVLSFPEGEVLHTFDEERDERSQHVAFTPDGKRLIGAWPGLRVWDLDTGKRIVSEKWDWERKGGSRPAFTPDGTPLPRPQAEQPVRPAVSPDGKWLYVCGSDNDFRVIDTGSGKQVKAVRRPDLLPNSFAPSPDGKTLAVASPDNVTLFSTEDFTVRKVIDLPKSTLQHRYCVLFPGNSDQLFVMGPSGKDGSAEIKVWDCKKGEFTLCLPPVWPSDNIEPGQASGVVAAEGRYGLISQNAGGDICGVYDLNEGKYLGYIRTRKGRGGPVVSTPDGKHLIGGLMSDNLVVVKVEDVLKLIENPSPPKKQ